MRLVLHDDRSPSGTSPGDRWQSQPARAWSTSTGRGATRCSRRIDEHFPDGAMWTRAGGWLLRVGHAAPSGSTPRRCSRPPWNAGSPTCPARPSTRTAAARTRCASRSATRPRTGSVRGSSDSGRCCEDEGPALPEPAPMKIAVLAGGRTPERDVSLRSGQRVKVALEELGHDASVRRPGGVRPGRDPRWRRRPTCATWRCTARRARTAPSSGCWTCSAIPYTGTAAFDCEVAFDKVLAKDALARAQVRTPEWVTIEGWALRDLGAGAALGDGGGTGRPALRRQTLEERLGAGGGVRRAGGRSRRGRHGGPVVQRSRRDRDARSSVPRSPSGSIGSPPEPLPCVEIVPKGGVFDYAARYTAGATDYFAPARVGDEVTAACTAIATTQPVPWAFGTSRAST